MNWPMNAHFLADGGKHPDNDMLPDHVRVYSRTTFELVFEESHDFVERLVFLKNGDLVGYMGSHEKKFLKCWTPTFQIRWINVDIFDFSPYLFHFCDIQETDVSLLCKMGTRTVVGVNKKTGRVKFSHVYQTLEEIVALPCGDYIVEADDTILYINHRGKVVSHFDLQDYLFTFGTMVLSPCHTILVVQFVSELMFLSVPKMIMTQRMPRYEFGKIIKFSPDCQLLGFLNDFGRISVLHTQTGHIFSQQKHLVTEAITTVYSSPSSSTVLINKSIKISFFQHDKLASLSCGLDFTRSLYRFVSLKIF